MPTASAAQPSYPHIGFDSAGVPIIAGTTFKVVELITAHEAHGWSPAELHFQFPHLSLGQIHSAFAYYWDHKKELDRDIERRAEWSEQLRHEIPVPPAVERLRALKPKL